jgi:hypothetical protein
MASFKTGYRSSVRVTLFSDFKGEFVHSQTPLKRVNEVFNVNFSQKLFN